MTPLQPNRVTIDLSAIKHNFDQVRQAVPKSQKILCVIKSNAYGHGLEQVSDALVAAGADFFGVRDIQEGVRLREHGVQLPILFLLGILDTEFETVVQHNLTPVIYHLETARAFNEYLTTINQLAPIHIKIDSGMTRLGVPAEQVATFFEGLKELKQLTVEGVLTHMADATDSEYTICQAKTMHKVRQQITSAGWEIPLWHFSNSVAAVRDLFPESQMVRAGIVLYGAYPTASMQSEIDLKAALSWTSEILDLKSVPAGTPISYDCTFVTRRTSQIAILPLGYADGLPRQLSNRGQVLIRGHRAPIVGRICMDLTMVDVTDIPEAKIGDRVTLIGRDGGETISSEDVAEWAETISYEILTRIAERVPRYYQE